MTTYPPRFDREYLLKSAQSVLRAGAPQIQNIPFLPVWARHLKHWDDVESCADNFVRRGLRPKHLDHVREMRKAT